jgi:hypothetical protein
VKTELAVNWPIVSAAVDRVLSAATCENTDVAVIAPVESSELKFVGTLIDVVIHVFADKNVCSAVGAVTSSAYIMSANI